MILFIDDEPRGIDSFIEELRFSNYEVIFKENVDDALKYLKDNHDRIELVILDVMMPPGETFKDVDTGNCLRTGLILHREIRKYFPELPIILFTNFSLDEQLQEETSQSPKSRFLHKPDFLPFELVEEIKQFLSELK